MISWVRHVYLFCEQVCYILKQLIYINLFYAFNYGILEPSEVIEFPTVLFFTRRFYLFILLWHSALSRFYIQQR